MDDKRVTVDLDLRTKVLDVITNTHKVAMLDLIYAFTALAVSRNLEPSPPLRRETLSGDVPPDLEVYQMVQYFYNTQEPRRVAHELANSAMAEVAGLPLENMELFEIFGLKLPHHRSISE